MSEEILTYEKLLAEHNETKQEKIKDEKRKKGKETAGSFLLAAVAAGAITALWSFAVIGLPFAFWAAGILSWADYGERALNLLEGCLLFYVAWHFIFAFIVRYQEEINAWGKEHPFKWAEQDL